MRCCMHMELNRGWPKWPCQAPFGRGGVVGYSDSLFGSFQDTISLRSLSQWVGLTEVGSSLKPFDN